MYPPHLHNVATVPCEKQMTFTSLRACVKAI